MEQHGVVYKVTNKVAWVVLVGLASVGAKTIFDKVKTTAKS